MSVIANRLRNAKALIEDPEHWTTGESARDADGYGTDPKGPDAVAWCALGACQAANVDPQFLYKVRPTRSVATTNDGPGGHKAVLDLFDRAIRIAEAS